MERIISLEELRSLREKYDVPEYRNKGILTGEIKNRLVYFYAVKVTWSEYHIKHRGT